MRRVGARNNKKRQEFYDAISDVYNHLELNEEDRKILLDMAKDVDDNVKLSYISSKFYGKVNHMYCLTEHHILVKRLLDLMQKYKRWYYIGMPPLYPLF
ncbi:hypothetical protein [Streptococcus sciuri]|uniref:Bacteriocin immunity protein n=1 Tax=Streptococcus sciuri TaxID=2973939 RepID=A0ABT2F6Q0_9STRE|nr:hypothetical protein [Streptococcus sciuri]MCS4488170.1 hypothetical protein [Streptococcus sciuri]